MFDKAGPPPRRAPRPSARRPYARQEAFRVSRGIALRFGLPEATPAAREDRSRLRPAESARPAQDFACGHARSKCWSQREPRLRAFSRGARSSLAATRRLRDFSSPTCEFGRISSRYPGRNGSPSAYIFSKDFFSFSRRTSSASALFTVAEYVRSPVTRRARSSRSSSSTTFVRFMRIECISPSAASSCAAGRARSASRTTSRSFAGPARTACDAPHPSASPRRCARCRRASSACRRSDRRCR